MKELNINFYKVKVLSIFKTKLRNIWGHLLIRCLNFGARKYKYTSGKDSIKGEGANSIRTRLWVGTKL